VNLRVGFGATVWSKGVAHQALDGIGYYTQSLAQALDASNVECHPVAFGQTGASLQQQAAFQHPFQSAPRYPWSALRSFLTGANFSAYAGLRGRIDLFHATDHHIPKLKGIPLVATLFDAIPLSHPEWGNPKLRWLKNEVWKRTVAWADQVIPFLNFPKQKLFSTLALLKTASRSLIWVWMKNTVSPFQRISSQRPFKNSN